MQRIVLTGICCLLAAGAARPAAAAPAGEQAPDFVLKSLAGENLRLSEYRGEVVMLSFWASWCGQCRAQLRGLADVYARYRGAGAELFAVSLDRSRRDAEDAAASLGLTYPVLFDAGGKVGALYGVDSMPELVLIDRDGVVRKIFAGYRRGEEQQYLHSVRDLLRE
jgi:peroxiredoxin